MGGMLTRDLTVYLHLIVSLRPEIVESAMYLYRATKDPYLLEIGVDILESIEYSARTPCGYATVSLCVCVCVCGCSLKSTYMISYVLLQCTNGNKELKCV